MTGWAVLGLEAAGSNPLDLGAAATTPISYLRSAGRPAALRPATSSGRSSRCAAPVSIRAGFGGADLVAELRSRRGANGSVGGQVNLTAFGILALRAAGADQGSLGRSARWLRHAQNQDGGWGFQPGAASDPDSTGAALQGLAVGGRRGGRARARARWLRAAQRGGGGFALATTGVVNAQSTAWAVQGLIAAGGIAGAVGALGARLPRPAALDRTATTATRRPATRPRSG